MPDEIKDIGTFANHFYNPKDHNNYYSSKEYDKASKIVERHEILSHDYFAFLYNDRDGNIILQISPTYPLRYVRKNKKPPYNNFLHWLKKTYKPKLTRIIPKNIAQDWLMQSQQILTIINQNIHEAFRKDD